MENKTILLITDDNAAEAAVRELLEKAYSLDVVKSGQAAAAYLSKKTADLIILDHDLKKEDGLRVLSGLQTSAKIIMLSASGGVPLAVAATKMGVEDFLRKPIDAPHLKASVEKNISRKEVKLRWGENMEWLCGESPALLKMLEAVRGALMETREIILTGERGVPRGEVARFIHVNRFGNGRRLVKLDVAGFRRESLETHFWAALQELMSLPEKSSVQNEIERCGTLYLDNVENLDSHFTLTILKFFKQRKGKIDKSIQVVIGVSNRAALRHVSAELEKDYNIVDIPPLRYRKQDIPYLLESYMHKYSVKYGKAVKFISASLLDFLMSYDYPGNYLELERLLEEAVGAADSDKLDESNFPFDLKGILQDTLKKCLGGNATLEEAKRKFEKSFFLAAAAKSDEEGIRAARFLDMPRAVLRSRLENLLD